MDLTNVDMVAIKHQIEVYELQQKLQSLQASVHPNAAQPAPLAIPPALLSLLAPPPAFHHPPPSLQLLPRPPGFSAPQPVYYNPPATHHTPAPPHTFTALPPPSTAPPPTTTAPPLPPPSLLAAPTEQELSQEPLLEGRNNSLTPEEAYHYLTQGTRYTEDIGVVANAKGGEVFIFKSKTLIKSKDY